MLDLLITNIAQLYTLDPKFSNSENPLGARGQDCIGFQNQSVVYIGSLSNAPRAKQVLDADGCIFARNRREMSTV